MFHYQLLRLFQILNSSNLILHSIKHTNKTYLLQPKVGAFHLLEERLNILCDLFLASWSHAQLVLNNMVCTHLALQ